ncbi:type II toxin-antitoxin system RelE/ParE family toxin [Bosea sp. LjRoot9]|uniref:type II toxin-antitoxin system RelE/ParE family toxin n=1 Tax=Bosea sp. LjRoot9 TaxID=3342341 RepID=UPI003ECE871D
MKLAFTPTARRDLQEIGDYIARDSRREALRFVTALEQFCTKLVSQPERYPILPRHAARNIRRAPHRDYLIFYRIGEINLEILRVLHAARDPDRIAESL